MINPHPDEKTYKIVSSGETSSSSDSCQLVQNPHVNVLKKNVRILEAKRKDVEILPTLLEITPGIILYYDSLIYFMLFHEIL